MKTLNKILYCGMADDILSPLLLVPDFTHLYVIDSFDSAFAENCTWEGQMQDIKNILLAGNDEKSHHRWVHLHYKKEWPVTSLDGPCKIISESLTDKCWTLSFVYNGVQRELIYFFRRNFYNIWPEEINNINHFMSMGAVCIRDKADQLVEEPILFKILKERTVSNCLYYDHYNFMYKSNKTAPIKIARNNEIIVLKFEEI